MARLSRPATPLHVRENPQHHPLSFRHARRSEKVAAVLNRWRIHQRWWDGAIERDYFRVRTESGLVCELYRNIPTGTWYLQRLHD